MKTVLIAALFLSFIGCASEKKKRQYEIKHPILVQLQEMGQKELTGKNAFVNYDQADLNRRLGTELTTSLITHIKNFLKTEGFVLVEKKNQAHLSLQIASDMLIRGFDGYIAATDANILLYKDAKITRKVTEIKNGVETESEETISPFLNRVAVTSVAYEYGKRPVFLKTIAFSTQHETWSAAKDEFLNNLAVELPKLALKVPEKNRPMKGLPGCIPMFGFDVENYNSQGPKEVAVIRVIANSPAKSIDMRTGDIVMAVDSMPFHAFSYSDKSNRIYEKMIPVPVKFRRNGREMRKTIKSKILCEY